MGNFDVEKAIVVPDSGGTGNNFLAGMLASACQQRGLDANAVMALCGNRNGPFGNGWDGIIALIVIAAIFGGNCNGLFGGNGGGTGGYRDEDDDDDEDYNERRDVPDTGRYGRRRYGRGRRY